MRRMVTDAGSLPTVWPSMWAYYKRFKFQAVQLQIITESFSSNCQNQFNWSWRLIVVNIQCILGDWKVCEKYAPQITIWRNSIRKLSPLNKKIESTVKPNLLTLHRKSRSVRVYSHNFTSLTNVHGKRWKRTLLCVTPWTVTNRLISLVFICPLSYIDR